MAKNTCTSCGGSGVVKRNIQQDTHNPSMGKDKEKSPQRKKPSKGVKNNGN
jgi:hypothetical protein